VTEELPTYPVVAVGAIVQRDGALLLVQRAREPARGKWSVPGGRVQFGEALAEAVVREVREETGLAVRVERFAGWAEGTGSAPAPYHHVILDFFVTEAEPGAPAHAGDDASDLRWVPMSELGTVDLVDGLAEFLRSVGVGPSETADGTGSFPV
jgi:8-oxo-dGTP diphosphatase